MLRKKSSKLKLTNFLKVADSTGSEIKDELFILNGKITVDKEPKKANDVLEIDCKNCILAPGFIDPQVNGFNKCNFWDVTPDYKEIDKLRLDLAYCGVTAFCPTLITAPVEKIVKSIDHINSYIEQSEGDAGAAILGIHIEGVFITKFGVHEGKYVQNNLTPEAIKPFLKDNVILFTLAPELDLTGEAIKLLKQNNILVSVGHSNATYKEGKAAIEKYDLNTVTHMFNALRGINGFSHRDKGFSGLEILKEKIDNEKKINPDEDGIMLALLKDKNLLCMIIADGIHVNLEVVRFLKEVKGKANFSLASDIVSSDFYNESKSRGILGGGQITLNKCVQNLIKCNILNIEDSLISASKPIISRLNTGKYQRLGEISVSSRANIVIWNTKKNNVKGTIIGQNAFLNY